MMPTVDIIIVSYNTQNELDACLASLHAPPPRVLGRIMVVDNASRDGSVAHVRNHWPNVQVVALDRNAGFAVANNIAIRQSTASHVLLLNSDTVVPPGAIDALLERLIERGAAAVGPRLVDANGRPEVSFGRMLSPWTEIAQRLRVRAAGSSRPFVRRYIERLVSRERDVDWISGACLLVDRRAATDAGLLDERYFMYEEDVDFCATLRARGGRVVFTPHVEVRHLRGRSSEAAGASVHAIYDRSHIAFYEKHAPRWAPLLRLWLRARGRASASTSPAPNDS